MKTPNHKRSHFSFKMLLSEDCIIGSLDGHAFQKITQNIKRLSSQKTASFCIIAPLIQVIYHCVKEREAGSRRRKHIYYKRQVFAVMESGYSQVMSHTHL